MNHYIPDHKAENIKKFLEGEPYKIEDIKDNILLTALEMGENCHELIENELVTVSNAFWVLRVFNDILDSVE